MSLHLFWKSLAALLLVSTALVGAEPERWADEDLPVKKGLIVWLDASRQQSAWQAHRKPPLADGTALDVWYDGSGHKLHFAQRTKAAQPRWLGVGDKALVRFDGQDDFLGIESVLRSTETFTAFIVAAPRSNQGGFRALMAGYESGHNDYLTGFTVDLNGGASAQLDQINVEGKGFVGAVDLLNQTFPFQTFHTIETICSAGPEGLRLLVDGQATGERKRDRSVMKLDGLMVGARCYSNSSEPPAAGGFLDGDVAELLLYDRTLDDQERTRVRKYLADKYAGMTDAVAAMARRGGRRHQPLEKPPLVQMLVPGFTVEQLPLDLTNINNIRYRQDGKLIALGYNGNIHVLSDSDGDGLEDHAELFWQNDGRLRGPIGIDLTPPGYRHPSALPQGGFGVFVASKGKLSLIIDDNDDDRADREVVVASGWQEIPQNVDALGAALAKDGSVYFALGTANFANGYLLDENGKAHYDLASERGTVLRVSPDFSSREIVCTGVRFPVALAFNRHGDLFCTDQEGATWLPNGNPFDELLHIQPGRHYGFPPRHPKHLPGVIDEPSVFDYGPQHQSTCGLVFNEPVHGGPVFGPSWWEGDALICGESRGKIFRTKLAKSPSGYVALNQTIAALGMLTVDACVSPRGDLIVACHSGPPDWGTGPVGKGKLFRIRMTDHEHPQPVLAWAAGPRELRVAFDRPLGPAHLQDIARQAAIQFGPTVQAGDRFEVLQPPYAVVQQQSMMLRYDLPVHGVQVSADRRTLVLATGPQSDPTMYALTLPAPARQTSSATPVDLRQIPAIDLAYELSGLDVRWKSQDAQTEWSGWFPHLDLDVARTFTAGSAEHDSLWPLLSKPGQFTVRTQLDLHSMLRPAVQLGTSLDYVPPPEQVTVTVESSQPLQIEASGAELTSSVEEGQYRYRLAVTPAEDQWLPLEITFPTGLEEPVLRISFSTGEDARPRPVALHRFRLPWTNPLPLPAQPDSPREIPQLAGGDWTRGRAIFSSDAAACSKCHTLRGQGGRIGPDLSNLPHRSYESVLRDLVEPSATINPDHTAFTLVLNDGRLLSGVIVSSDKEKIILGDNTGKELEIARSDIELIEPSPTSGMPADLVAKLQPNQLRDLLTYLMTEPLRPAPLQRRDAPPPRRRSEIEPLLKQFPAPAGPHRPLHIALVAGPKDHGPDEHDYPLWQERWSKLLELGEQIQVSQASQWPTERQLESADVIVFNSANPAWTAAKAAELDAFLARGGGLVYIHFATNGREATGELAERIGLAAQPASLRFRHGPLDLQMVDPQHPITRGFDAAHGLETVHFVDESYWKMTGSPNNIHVLATAVEEGEPRPLLWTREHLRGRIFVSILGHYTWTYDDPLFRLLLLRGILWTAREPADRLTELSTVGARIEP